MSSDATSKSREQEEQDLLLAALRERSHSFGIYPVAKRDLKSLSETDRCDVWARLQEFYRQHVLKQAPKVNLRKKMKDVRVGNGTERAWVIWIRGDLRAGIQWKDGTLTLVRVGPHSGSKRIYVRASS